jgi:preprotein translocase subunit Sec61beta
MGMSGTGLINYFQTFEKSLQLNPKYIILSFYFGNDFSTTSRHFHMDDANKIFGSKALELEARIREAEINNPVNYEELTNRCKYREQNTEITQIAEQRNLPLNSQIRESFTSSIDAVRHWLSENSRLYWLQKSFRDFMRDNYINDKVKTEMAYERHIRTHSEEERRSCFQFSDGDWKTVFENTLRSRLLNSHDVRTLTALDVAKKISGVMNSTIKELGGEFLVILFPTKESVFSNRINTENIPEPGVYSEMESIIRSEKFLKDSLVEYFDEEGIAYIDMLPHLQGAERQPFFGHADMHPNKSGNLVIAKTVYDFIKHYFGVGD